MDVVNPDNQVYTQRNPINCASSGSSQLFNHEISDNKSSISNEQNLKKITKGEIRILDSLFKGKT